MNRVVDQPAKLLCDEDRFGAAAQKMVSVQLEARGIRAPRVLAQMRSVPRHAFVEPAESHSAYDDRALPTLHSQTISQPYMVALMTELLELQPAHRVLEIGTGSGYQTMILARLARRVISIELNSELAQRARDVLAHFNIANVSIYVGDGSLGWPADAPYDCILVTAGAPGIPASLVEQLSDPGRLVIPVGEPGVQTLIIVDKREGELSRRKSIDCRFVPLVGEQAWPQK